MKAVGNLGVGPGLAVNLDQTLLHDSLHLLHTQGIPHPVPWENSKLEVWYVLNRGE